MTGLFVHRRAVLAALVASAATTISPWHRVALAQGNPLPSWNEGKSKQALLDFVAAVTSEGSPDFVPTPERIAVFDNDGTLWCEQPMYVQLAFALDRIKTLSDEHPEWKQLQPFQAVLDNDLAALAKSGEKGLVELVMASHAGMSTQQFAQIATDWIKTARHPKFDRPYTELVYKPMLEVLSFLRANGFKTFIVSGGGIEFIRPWTDQVYGIPPEQVVGSSIKVKYEMVDGAPELMRLAEINFIDDKAGKPDGINQHIGRRPIAAFGNSDGDLEMLEWTTITDGKRLGMLVHHDDPEREYAYDRTSHTGKLDKGLSEALERGWTLISMKDDWKTIFPGQ